MTDIEAIVSFKINDHLLKFGINSNIQNKHYPPSPPNYCHSDTITNADNYAALITIVNDNVCDNIEDTYSQLDICDLNSKYGIKVQGKANSIVHISDIDVINIKNLSNLRLVNVNDSNSFNFNLLNNDSISFNLPSTGLDILTINTDHDTTPVINIDHVMSVINCMLANEILTSDEYNDLVLLNQMQFQDYECSNPNLCIGNRELTVEYLDYIIKLALN